MMESGRIAVSLRPVKIPRLDWDSYLCHSGSDNLKSEQLTACGERKAERPGAANTRRCYTFVFLSENMADEAVPRGVFHRKF